MTMLSPSHLWDEALNLERDSDATTLKAADSAQKRTDGRMIYLKQVDKVNQILLSDLMVMFGHRKLDL